MKLLDSKTKNQVLEIMSQLLAEKADQILAANQLDTDAYDPNDRAMYDRLVVDAAKVQSMIQSLDEVRQQPDPVGVTLSQVSRPNGLDVKNTTAPFGSILIIYESRPDVTIEAASLAFKSGNRILLKGGKEAIHTNRILVQLWHAALEQTGLSKDWIQLLELDRTATQDFLRNPDQPLDLIVPRGGDALINFVKTHATCPVLVSGRGNNFLFVHRDADWEMSQQVILNAKTAKISACNALDKVLLDRSLPELTERLAELISKLQDAKVSVILSDEASQCLNGTQHDSLLSDCESLTDQATWTEEFLAMKIVVGISQDIDDAVSTINRFSGGHSAVIMTQDNKVADDFFASVDCAAVYQNASSRFTDGGQLGAGAELAISTDKLHHRGPLGLQQLVTNKYIIRGNGQVRD